MKYRGGLTYSEELLGSLLRVPGGHFIDAIVRNELTGAFNVYLTGPDCPECGELELPKPITLVEQDDGTVKIVRV